MVTRIRSGFQRGTTTNDPLTDAGTSISSAEFEGLPVVSGSDVLALVLDPEEAHGAPEIVYVTEHTSESPTVTVTRGAEGTMAREHPQLTEWRHGPTTYDYTATASSAPSSPFLGQLWMDTDESPPLLKQWDGSAWMVVGIPDPRDADPGQVLKVNALSDGYEFGRAGMKRSIGGGPFLIPAGPDDPPVVASASGHGYGAWVELEDVTAADLLILGVSIEGAGPSGGSVGEARWFQVDIGLGAAASEVSVGEVRAKQENVVTGSAAGGGSSVVMLPTPILVPSGSRIAARTADFSGSALNNGVVLIAVNLSDLEDF